MQKRSPNDKPDPLQQAVRNVNEITDSEPADGEDVLESEELKRQYREIKKRLDAPLPEPSSEKPVE